MSVFFRRRFRTVTFSRFLTVVLTTSHFLNEFFHGKFAPGFCVSILKETIARVWDYLSETRKKKRKLPEKYIWKRNMKSFSNKILNVFFRNSSYILDLAKTVWTLRILWQKVTRNLVMKKLWRLQNHVLVNM